MGKLKLNWVDTIESVKTGESGMKDFVHLLFNVVFCFALGIAFLTAITYASDFLLGTDFDQMHRQVRTMCRDNVMLGAYLLCGFAALAWAIRDGQFVGFVKPSHWTQKERDARF